jgi:hypothetical protein
MRSFLNNELTEESTVKTAAILVLILSLVLPIILAGCGVKDAEAACTCETGKTGGTTWCAECDKGYVDGEATACKGCYGQKTGGPACESCASK